MSLADESGFCYGPTIEPIVFILAGGAGEVFRVVDAAAACVLCDPRIWAEGPAHFRLPAADGARGDDLIGCATGLLPLFDRGEPIRLIGTDTAAALADARQEEQWHPVVLFTAEVRRGGF